MVYRQQKMEWKILWTTYYMLEPELIYMMPMAIFLSDWLVSTLSIFSFGARRCFFFVQNFLLSDKPQYASNIHHKVNTTNGKP